MEEEIKQEKTVEHLTEEIKVLLNDISFLMPTHSVMMINA